MKLRTSFFNPSAMKKDITRFAPLWGLYTVFMLLVVFLIGGDTIEPAYFATDAPYIMLAMGFVNLVYGGLSALLLFGDLFQTRMAGALHAMPLRREGWFLTHFAAGLLFCVVPNCAGALIAAMYLQEYCYLAFVWLAVMILQYLFFFGTGTFCIQCAGNRLGAIACYGLFHFFAVLVSFLIHTFYFPLLHGMELNFETACSYSPVIKFCMSNYFEISYDNMEGIAIFQGFLWEDWRYLLISTGIGLLLAGAALLLYRKRQLERAGDFIAVKPAAPVFLLLYTLCVGAVLYFIADSIGSDLEYLFLIIGFAIAFFTGWMLLEKKVNIFSVKRLLGFGAVSLLFFLTIALAWLDPFGITRYVPEPQQIQYVEISPYASYYYMDNESMKLSDPADIDVIRDIHESLTENRTNTDRGLCLRLRYTLKSGVTVNRKYYIPADNKTLPTLKEYFSDFEYVTNAESVDQLIDSIYLVEFRSHYESLPNIKFSTAAENAENGYDGLYSGSDKWLFYELKENTQLLRSFLSAIEADCNEGTMSQLWELHNGESMGNLTIRYFGDGYTTEYLDITIYYDSKNTVSFLKALAE